MSPLPGSPSSGVDRLVNNVCLMAVIAHAQVLGVMKREANNRQSVGSGRLHRRDEVWGVDQS